MCLCSRNDMYITYFIFCIHVRKIFHEEKKTTQKKVRTSECAAKSRESPALAALRAMSLCFAALLALLFCFSASVLSRLPFVPGAPNGTSGRLLGSGIALVCLRCPLAPRLHEPEDFREQSRERWIKNPSRKTLTMSILTGRGHKKTIDRPTASRLGL